MTGMSGDKPLRIDVEVNVVAVMSRFTYIVIIQLVALLTLMLTSLASKAADASFDKVITAYVKQFDYHHGLSQSSINDLVQDENGFIWLATEDGLNRFDGYHFDAYRSAAGIRNQIEYGYIFTLLAGDEQDLWIGLDKIGVNYLSLKDGVFNHPDNPALTPKRIGSVRSLHLDDQSRLWVGYYSSGLTVHELATDEQATYNNRQSTYRLPAKSVYAITSFNGNTWLATSDGVFKTNASVSYDQLMFQPVPVDGFQSGKTSHWLVSEQQSQQQLWLAHESGLYLLQHGVFNKVPGIADEWTITDIAEGPSGNIWLTTSQGFLLRVSPDSLTVDRIVLRQLNASSAKAALSAILVDNAGLLWIGTVGKGVYQLDPGQFQFSRLPLDSEHAPQRNIIGVFNDQAGNTWFSSDGLLMRMDERGVAYAPATGCEFLTASNTVGHIAQSRDGTFWLSTRQGLIEWQENTRRCKRYQLPDKSLKQAISHSFEDTNGTIWVSTWGRGLYRKTPGQSSLQRVVGKQQKLPWRYFRHTTQDNDGVLWLSSYRGLMSITLDESGDVETVKIVERFGPSPASTVKVPATSVYSSQVDGDILWIATRSGLVRFNRFTGQSEVFTTQHGLSNDIVYSVMNDELGNLWLGTNQGLSRFSPATQRFKNYYMTHGISSDEFNSGVFSKGADGQLYFGTINGITRFDAKALMTMSQQHHVLITHFWRGNDRLDHRHSLPGVDYLDTVSLSYPDHEFSLLLSGSDFRYPDSMTFRVKLDGYDDEWRERRSDNRLITYTNLDPGRYTLAIQTTNDDGEWQVSDRKLHIDVAPPIWQSTYAYVAYLLIAAWLIGMLFWSRHKYQQAQEKRALWLEAEVARRTLQIHQQNEALSEQNDQLKRLTDYKQRMQSFILHDLKTPLNAIDYGLTEQSGQWTSLVKISVEQMKRLIANVLDIERNLEGQLTLQAHWHSADALIGQAADILHAEFTAKAIQLNRVVAADQAIYADERYLVRVLVNLLSNAIKFSDKHTSVDVTVTCDKDRVFLTVRDYGVGMSDDIKRKIFTPFYSESPDHQPDANGLGLAFCDNVIKAHGGTIAVTSEPGVGSEFVLTLPQHTEGQRHLAQEAATARTYKQHDKQAKHGKSGRVLLVEDSAIDQTYTRNLLLDAHFNVEAASTGFDAIQALNLSKTRGVFDLVLLDLHLPDIDSLQLAVQLRRQLPEQAKIIALTAVLTTDTEQRVSGVGLDGVLEKPLDMTRLMALIQASATESPQDPPDETDLAQTDKVQTDKTRTDKAGQATTSKQLIIDTAHLDGYRQQTPGADTEQDSAFHALTERLLIRLDEAAAFFRAMDEATLSVTDRADIDDSQADTIRQQLHTYAGTAGNFGMKALREFCRQGLEQWEQGQVPDWQTGYRIVKQTRRAFADYLDN